MTDEESNRPSINLTQGIAIAMLALTGKSTLEYFVETLRTWDYSVPEIVAAFLLPAIFGFIISTELRTRYWRTFEYGFVAVYTISLVARLAGAADPAVSIFVVSFCVCIMFVVQIVTLHVREIRRRPPA